jgi:hypothetical protein
VITYVPVTWEIVSVIVFIRLKTTAMLKPSFLMYSIKRDQDM